MKLSSKAKAVIFALICVFLWALIPVVAKIGQSGLDNHQFLFWSSLVSFLTFLIIIGSKKQLNTVRKLIAKNWIHAASLGLLGTYLYYILLYFGYANAKGIEVLVIQYSWPIFVVILSVIILKEKLTLFRVLSILLGFLGVFLVLSKGKFTEIHFDNLKVDILVFIAAFVFALFSVLSKSIKLEPLKLIAIYYLTATIVSFFSMIVFSEYALPQADTLIPILINGIFVNGISYLFWIKALKEAEASFVAPFVFLTPVISAIYLVFFFREEFLPIYAVGMVAIIIGGLLNR